MARTKGSIKPSGLIGSAATLRTDTDFTLARKGNAWQKLAWGYYDTIGEYRYTVDWLGAMVGKTRLYPGEIVDGTVREITDPSHPIAQYVDDLFGGPAAKSETMRQLGIHFTVAGEALVLGTAREYQPGDFVDSGWYVVASSELVKEGTEAAPRYRVNGVQIPGDQHVVRRVWQPHPVRFGESNSASRAVLPILEELRVLTAHTMAQLTSRLAGAGVWLLSDELTLPTRQNEDGETVIAASTPDEIIAALVKAGSTALKDPGSAASLFPLVITAPAAAIEASKLQTFWTPLDEHSKEMRDEALRRVGLGMDVPPEVLTGMAETNHWAAWASDESGIKAHGEPLAGRIVQALTEGLLWDYAKTVDDPNISENFDSFVIAGDTSAMRLRPNRAKEALELYDRGELSAKALIRETGFDDEDIPSEEEYSKWITKRIANGSATPEQMAAALALLGVEGIPSGVEQVEIDYGREQRPQPSLREHPLEGPPDQEVGERRKQRRDEERSLAASGPAVDPALMSACEMAMLRAMERAGNKLRNKHGRINGVRAVDMYQVHGCGGSPIEHLLDDAWDHIRGMSTRLGVNPGSLQAGLTAYAEELFETKAEMSPERLAAHLVGVEKG